MEEVAAETTDSENGVNDRNPSPPPALFENEVATADMISGTVIQKQWILCTLQLAVQEVQNHDSSTTDGVFELSRKVEEEMCQMWDLTTNQSVCNFLMECDGSTTLLGIILRSCAPRLTEISVGILGNMMCNSDICKRLSNDIDFVKSILSLLSNPDSATLVETTRLLNTCVSTESISTVWLTSFKEKDIRDNIIFILESSVNIELLKMMAELLDSILYSDDEICNVFGTRDFVGSVLEASQQIGNCCPEVRDKYCHILQMLTTFSRGSQAIEHHSERVINLIEKVLKDICEDDHLVLKDHACGLASTVVVLRTAWVNETCLPNPPKGFAIMSRLLKLMWMIHGEESNSESSEILRELIGVLKESVLGLWCDVIENFKDPAVLDVLEKGPEKQSQVLFGELNKLPESRYIDRLKKLVVASGQHNKLAELFKKKC